MDERIKASRKQEKDGARRFGGRVNSRSGAGDLFKSDVRTDDSLIEFKCTTQASYRLRAGDLIKAWQHALLDGRSMIFGIEFLPGANNEYSPGSPTQYVVMTENDYLAMTARIKDLEETLAADAEFDRGWTS